MEHHLCRETCYQMLAAERNEWTRNVRTENFPKAPLAMDEKVKFPEPLFVGSIVDWILRFCIQF